jgi:signal transduction histidine kinase
MADGRRLDARDDGPGQATLDDEARLLRSTRLRLVAWSGVSTLVVLLLLGVALYAAVANTLQAASVAQLEQRVEPVARFLEGPDEGGEEPDQGFVLGGGNTLLYLFDDAGQVVQDRRGTVAVPEGLPDPAAIDAAWANGVDIRTSSLEIRTSDGSAAIPIRLLTERLVARQDGNTYFVQALQDRTTEVQTLSALLAVLVVGGVLVVIVAFGFGTLYARRALVPIRESLAGQRAALRRQREFAADASHELRTPLTVIRSSVEHLVRHRDEPVASSVEALEDIDAEVTHLSTLVDDLLLLARSDSGAVALERRDLDLGDVAADAASSLGRAADSRDVSVVVDPEPAMVYGDPARLRQLVMILRGRGRGPGARDPGRGHAARVRSLLARPGRPIGGHGSRARDREVGRGAARRPDRSREPARRGSGIPGRAARPAPRGRVRGPRLRLTRRRRARAARSPKYGHSPIRRVPP